MSTSAKRWSLWQSSRRRRVTAASASSGSTPRCVSLRLSSRLECSRRASSPTARSYAPLGLPSGAFLRSRACSGLYGFASRAGRDREPSDQQLVAQLLVDLVRHVRMLLEEHAGVVLALADALALVAVPGARLLDHVVQHPELDDLALARATLAVENLELGLAERRRELVLHDLHAGLGADHLLAALHRADAPDVEPHRGVELERVAARGGLGAAEHHADLHADLVDEDDHAVRARDVAGELAQRLAHEARLEADVRVPHLALDLGLRDERGDGVDHHDVDRVAAHERLGDLERLLAGVGLRHQELVEVD